MQVPNGTGPGIRRRRPPLTLHLFQMFYGNFSQFGKNVTAGINTLLRLWFEEGINLMNLLMGRIFKFTPKFNYQKRKIKIYHYYFIAATNGIFVKS